MDLTRKQVIEILEKADSTVYKEPKTKTAYALEYAISSLKTDEAYQIMYEGGEIFTKADVVAMLEKLKKEIMELPVHVISNKGTLIRMDIAPSAEDASELIQQKINELKGVEDGKDN